MIQRMNNVLVKHSKVLFGAITIIIIVSFVWFLTPGADGSLFFSRGANKVGTVFGDPITIKDMEHARDCIQMGQILELYGYQPETAKIARLDNIDQEMMFDFAACVKAAKKQGYTASDNELRNMLSAIPAFQDNKAFSQAKYEQFKKDCLEPRGFSFEDFENALRERMALQKFYASAGANVTVTDDELARALVSTAEKMVYREITFNVNDFKKAIKISDADIKAEYEANGKEYLSPAESDALMVYLNFNDAKTTDVDEKEVEDQYKAFGWKDKDGKDVPAKQAKAEIRAKLTLIKKKAAATQQLNKFFLSAHDLAQTPEFKQAPAATLKAAAEKAGFKVAELKKLTEDSPETVIISKAVIESVTALPIINTYSQPVINKDSAAFTMLTKRVEPKPLSLADAQGKIRAKLTDTRADAVAMEKARAFRADVVAGKVNAATIIAKAKDFGGTAGNLKEEQNLPVIVKVFQNYKNIPAQYQASFMNQLQMLVTPNDAAPGFISEPRLTGAGVYGMVYVADKIAADKAPTDEEKEAVLFALLSSKRAAASAEWGRWLDSNTVRPNFRDRK